MLYGHVSVYMRPSDSNAEDPGELTNRELIL
jgi:hypothetical protein